MTNLSMFTFEMPVRRPRGDMKKAVGYMNLELGGGVRLEIQVREPSGYRWY